MVYLWKCQCYYIPYARVNTRTAGLRFIQRLHGMVEFVFIRKASHVQNKGDKMSNLVIDLTLHIRQNSTYDMQNKNGCFKFQIFKISQVISAMSKEEYRCFFKIYFRSLIILNSVILPMMYVIRFLLIYNQSDCLQIVTQV